MVAADIRHLIRCVNTDLDPNPTDHANRNPNTAKHDHCNDASAYLDASFDCYTDLNANPDFNFDACFHVHADRDSYANEFPHSDTDIDDTGTGGSRPDRTASRKRGDSELGRRGRRSPLRTMVVDFSRGLDTDRPRQPDRHELYPLRTVSRH